MTSIFLSLSSTGKRLYLRASYKEVVSICDSLCGSWDKLNKVFTFSAKPKTVYRVVGSFKDNKDFELSQTNEVVSLCEKYLKKQELQKKKNEELLYIKEHGHEFDVDFSYLKVIPFPFQKSGKSWLEAADGLGCIADEMGLGKTFQAISYCSHHKFPTLVICPASVKINWLREISHFTNDKAFIFKNGEDIPLEFDYLVMNYESLISKKKPKDGRKKSTLEQLFSLVKKGKIQAIVCDEAHRMKNQKAKSTKVIHKEFKAIPHRILLTGTPIKSRPIEYFSLLKFLDKDYWNSKAEFGARYCGAKKTWFGNRGGIDYSGASNLKELYEETIPYVLRREQKDVFKDLPEKIYTNIPLVLPDDVRKEYDKLEGELLDELEDLTDEQLLTIKIKLPDFTKIHRLRQLTSDYKLPFIQDVVDSIVEDQGKKVIIFSQYLNPIHKLDEYYKNKCVIYTGGLSEKQKDDNLQKFIKDPKCQLFIVSIMAGGIGLDGLQRASAVEIFVDQPLTHADLAQAEGRVARIGQELRPQFMTFYCENTVDERIKNLQIQKRRVFAQVIDNREDNERIESTSLINDLLTQYIREKRKKKHELKA